MRNIAFSLVELMIVIAIISLLSVVGFVAYRSYHDRAVLAHLNSLAEHAATQLKTFYSQYGRYPQTPYEARNYLVAPGEGGEYVDYLAFYGPCSESTVSRFQITFHGIDDHGSPGGFSLVYHLAENDGVFSLHCRKNSFMLEAGVSVPTQCDADIPANDPGNGLVYSCSNSSPYNTYDSSIGAP